VPFHLPSAGHIYTSSKITEELIAHNYRGYVDWYTEASSIAARPDVHRADRAP